MVRLTGSVLPDADRTATTKSSRFCLFVPLSKLNCVRLIMCKSEKTCYE